MQMKRALHDPARWESRTLSTAEVHSYRGEAICSLTGPLQGQSWGGACVGDVGSGAAPEPAASMHSMLQRKAELLPLYLAVERASNRIEARQASSELQRALDARAFVDQGVRQAVERLLAQPQIKNLLLQVSQRLERRCLSARCVLPSISGLASTIYTEYVILAYRFRPVCLTSACYGWQAVCYMCFLGMWTVLYHKLVGAACLITVTFSTALQ